MRFAVGQPFGPRDRHQTKIAAAPVRREIGAAQDALAAQPQLFVGALGANIVVETIQVDAMSRSLAERPAYEQSEKF
jgi:hypothetical protein